MHRETERSTQELQSLKRLDLNDHSELRVPEGHEL